MSNDKKIKMNIEELNFKYLELKEAVYLAQIDLELAEKELCEFRQENSDFLL